MVDWCEATNYLWCSPLFHKYPCYDFIIVKLEHSDFFARLIFTFVCIIGADEYALALIQPFDTPVELRRSDHDLHFHCVKAKPRSKMEFISVRSIIRGAVLVEDFSRHGRDEYIVLDTVDADLFLRMAEKVSRLPLHSLQHA